MLSGGTSCGAVGSQKLGSRCLFLRCSLHFAAGGLVALALFLQQWRFRRRCRRLRCFRRRWCF
eukprot:14837304-Alexandrium_andersonii.AAC.1